jgi:hypothetical protein
VPAPVILGNGLGMVDDGRRRWLQHRVRWGVDAYLECVMEHRFELELSLVVR